MKRRELLKALLASFAVATLPPIREEKPLANLPPWKIEFKEIYAGWLNGETGEYYLTPEAKRIWRENLARAKAT